MSTETKKKAEWHDVVIGGKWRLTYKVRNSQGPQAFGGFHLPNYNSPFDHTYVRLRNVNFQAMGGYMIDSIVKDFKPDDDPNQKLLLNWMICHPWVNLQGVKEVDQRILDHKAKDGKNDGKITLTCLDYLEVSGLEDENYIDTVIGNLSQDKGIHSVGMKRLRYIMAQLDLPYAIPRFEPDVEKKALRSKLKTFVRKSMENAKIVNNIIHDIDPAKVRYEFKEMARTKVLVFSNGVYKFNNVPVGDNFETTEVFFNNHPEVRVSAINKLYKILES